MSSERRGAELLLGSIRAFRSVLLEVMVAVWRRWLQCGYDKGQQNPHQTRNFLRHAWFGGAVVLWRV